MVENIGSFKARVVRKDGDLSKTVYVDFRTEDGTALEYEDYLPSQGIL